MTYLQQLAEQQLAEQQPIAQRYPPHCWPIDSEPWSGREHRIARIYRDTREIADMLREWLDVDVHHPDAQRCHAMLVHFHARLKAKLASWSPQGPAH